MSEPRKLNTGSASGGFDQSQYEAARRRAQEQANQNARRRIIQQPAPSGRPGRSASRPPYRNRCRKPRGRSGRPPCRRHPVS